MTSTPSRYPSSISSESSFRSSRVSPQRSPPSCRASSSGYGFRPPPRVALQERSQVAENARAQLRNIKKQAEDDLKLQRKASNVDGIQKARSCQNANTAAKVAAARNQQAAQLAAKIRRMEESDAARDALIRCTGELRKQTLKTAGSARDDAIRAAQRFKNDSVCNKAVRTVQKHNENEEKYIRALQHMEDRSASLRAANEAKLQRSEKVKYYEEMLERASRKFHNRANFHNRAVSCH